MDPVVFRFKPAPTQMDLKGSTIEGIVGIAFMLAILMFFVTLAFVRHIRTRRPSRRAQRYLPASRRLRLDAPEGTVDNLHPPPPAYETLYPVAGRPQFRPWSWWATYLQLGNEHETADPSDGDVEEGTGSPSQLRSSPPSSPTWAPPLLPPPYELIACADWVRNTRTAAAMREPHVIDADAWSSLTTRERRREILVTEREISPSEG
ncbi:uncharacterized protein Z520_08109 [Fonsecaea multimorphosa CBS 102226]|uniref:Uncharacterized protein n=1 Tax=Fonsecaea multimorphosa CBS 102226 TaxID=1442371 RepID=A0A0D2IH02_9EURO|nr:uncharacterized protein Z520_08109 [Fonsecaea multimorphosa CBS 102226]KIX96331.1 hypothetical protein Z520_08109 [Fonsecaea multimorphosa CBS 102226]OAL21990.1 hypothetical protein AYO22_07587 [Fonsecaea multimorphosa]